MNWFKVFLASLMGFFIGMGLLVGVFFLIIFGLGRSGKKELSVKDNSVLELHLGAQVPDRASKGGMFFNNNDEEMNGPGLDEILNGIDAAIEDKKIKGIALYTDYYSGGLATAEEIRNKLMAFKKAGKFIYTYGEVYTEQGYYIASVADKVCLNPKGMMDFNGFAAQIMMYKGFFEKMGVKFEVFRAGKYKSAVEPFINDKLSEPNKEQISRYISSIFGHHLKQISVARGIDSGVLADIAANYKARSAQTAKELKIIDETVYKDQFEDDIKKKLGLKDEDKTHYVSFAKYAAQAEKSGEGKDKIAVIYCNGSINSGKDESGEGIGSESLAATIKKARLDKKIKAIVLRVNSPGGSALASDVIAREVELARKAKPVMVSIGNVAASGGYYISCMADSIFAQPNSITGSIGVFALISNITELYNNKLGLGYETVTTGKFSDMGRPDRPLTDDQRQLLQGMINQIYSDFLTVVGAGRHMDTAKVAELAQGHVYTAIDAKGLGLIDGLGGMDRAILAAARKAKLSKYRIVEMPRLKEPFEQFFGSKEPKESIKTAFKEEFGDAYNLYQQINEIKSLSGIQMRMPFTLSFK